MYCKIKNIFIFRKEMLFAGVFGGFITLAVSGTVANIISIFQIEFEQFSNKQNIQDIFISLLLSVLVAPLIEEILFRGALLSVLQERLKNRSAAILLCSAIFGVLHMDIIQSCTAFVYGIVFCLIACYTKSLIPAIISHSILNIGSSAINIAKVLNSDIPQYFDIFILLLIYTSVFIMSVFIDKHIGIKECLKTTLQLS
jgi:membrane protease YdiL (CAAX protease family)